MMFQNRCLCNSHHILQSIRRCNLHHNYICTLLYNWYCNFQSKNNCKSILQDTLALP